MSAAPSPEAISLHPHLGEERADPSFLRVDCHVHTMWSGDSTTTPAELALAVAGAGIDVLCITDHSTVAGAKRLAGELDCEVVVGQEQRTPEGEVIGLFLEERIPPGCRSALEAARFVRAQGGLVCLPHPFDPLRHHITEAALEMLAKEGLLDVIEVVNGKTSLDTSNEKARQAALRLDIAAAAGSDAHVPEAIGAAYVEMAPFDGPGQFLSALKGAHPVGHHFDAARRFSPRVVPSTREDG